MSLTAPPTKPASGEDKPARGKRKQPRTPASYIKPLLTKVTGADGRPPLELGKGAKAVLGELVDHEIREITVSAAQNVRLAGAQTMAKRHIAAAIALRYPQSLQKEMNDYADARCERYKASRQ